jgi:hypothetical protein
VINQNLEPRVVFCGENPTMTLYLEDQRVLTATYFICRYSPYGQGRLLIVRLEPDFAAAQGLQDLSNAVMTDNWLMASNLIEHHVKYMPDFKDSPLPDKLLETQLEERLDAKQGLVVRASVKDFALELFWSGMIEPMVLFFPNVTKQTQALESRSVAIPCRKAGLNVNGQLLKAVPKVVTHTNQSVTTSAYMTLSETWIESPDANEPDATIN